MKPRIKKGKAFPYQCFDRGYLFVGLGFTPKEAYDEWLKFASRENFIEGQYYVKTVGNFHNRIYRCGTYKTVGLCLFNTKINTRISCDQLNISDYELRGY